MSSRRFSVPPRLPPRPLPAPPGGGAQAAAAAAARRGRAAAAAAARAARRGRAAGAGALNPAAGAWMPPGRLEGWRKQGHLWKSWLRRYQADGRAGRRPRLLDSDTLGKEKAASACAPRRCCRAPTSRSCSREEAGGKTYRARRAEDAERWLRALGGEVLAPSPYNARTADELLETIDASMGDATRAARLHPGMRRDVLNAARRSCGGVRVARAKLSGKGAGRSRRDRQARLARRVGQAALHARDDADARRRRERVEEVIRDATSAAEAGAAAGGGGGGGGAEYLEITGGCFLTVTENSQGTMFTQWSPSRARRARVLRAGKPVPD